MGRRLRPLVAQPASDRTPLGTFLVALGGVTFIVGCLLPADGPLHTTTPWHFIAGLRLGAVLMVVVAGCMVAVGFRIRTLPEIVAAGAGVLAIATWDPGVETTSGVGLPVAWAGIVLLVTGGIARWTIVDRIEIPLDIGCIFAFLGAVTTVVGAFLPWQLTSGGLAPVIKASGGGWWAVASGVTAAIAAVALVLPRRREQDARNLGALILGSLATVFVLAGAAAVPEAPLFPDLPQHSVTIVWTVSLFGALLLAAGGLFSIGVKRLETRTDRVQPSI